ncbi:MAG: S8 family serine peptidase [Candidatus Omnitrophica bacterium]|nr:S8 family serine peptidase [Candidatus Omnitrophota bacterium]
MIRKQILPILQKKRIIIGIFALFFLFVFPHFISERIQAGQILWSNQGPSLPGKNNQEIVRLLQNMLKEAEKESAQTGTLSEPEDLSEEEKSESGEVIYLGKVPNQDKKIALKRENEGKNSPALVIPGKEEEKPSSEESPEPSAEGPKDDLRLIAPGQGGPGVVPNPPGNNPPGNNPGQEPAPSPKPTNPPKPPFKWKFADPNRPKFEKIKLEDARPTSLNPEELRKLVPGKDYESGKVLIKYNTKINAAEVMAEGMNLESAEVYDVKSLWEENNLFILEINEKANIGDVCEELLRNPDIEYCEPNYIYKIYKTPNDSMYNQLWGLQKIQAEKAWDINEGSSSVIVGVSDTGVDGNHPDLKDNLVSGKSFVDNSPTADNVGHGTHVAGTIAAVGNNGQGVIGVAPKVKIMPLKISNSPNVELAFAIESIRYAADNGAKVINMSWGGGMPSASLQDALRYAASKDVVLVAAAGNGGGPGVAYPAAFPEVIAVSATNPQDQLANFSSYGSEVEVSAPGEGILSTWPGGKYQPASGTSMASPHTAGVVALIRSVFPNLRAEEVRKKLIESVDDLGSPGKDERFGYGRINAFKAIQGGGGSPSPSPTPPPGGGGKFTPHGYLTSSLKTGDFNGDGKEEIVFISTKEYKQKYSASLLYVLDGEGRVFKDFPYEYKGQGWTTPAIADIDHDGNLDIVVTTYPIEDSPQPGISPGGNLSINTSILGGEEGVIFVQLIWVEDYWKAPGSPVCMDIDGDGRMDIVITFLDTSRIYSGLIEQKIGIISSQKGKYILEPKDVKLVYQAVENDVIQACTPVVGDFNNDEKVEIVLGDAQIDGKLYLLVALDAEGNVIAKVENPTGKASLYSRVIAIEDMYKKESTAFVLVRATEEKDEIYTIDLFGEGILNAWPKESDKPFQFYDTVPVNIDGDSNMEFAVRGEDLLPVYHHEGSIAGGYPVKDEGGNVRTIKSGKGKKEYLLANAIYAEEGKLITKFNKLPAGTFVMDEAVGKFNSDNEEVYLLIVKDGKEYLERDSLPERDTEELSSWPMYRRSGNNLGILPVDLPSPSPSPSPKPNNPPQFKDIPDQTVSIAQGTLTLDVSQYASDPDGDTLSVTFDWKKKPTGNFMAIVDARGNFTLTLLGGNQPEETIVTFQVTDPKGASATKDCKITITN